MANQPPSDDVGRPAPEVGPGRLLAVPAVDEAERQRVRPAGRHGGGVAHHADHRSFEVGVADRPPPVRQGVDPAQIGVDEIGLVVLPAGLVLLRAPVVVDGEQDGAGRLGRRAQVERRLPAPGADLHEGGGAGPGERGPSRPQGGEEQRLALVVGHEAPGLAGRPDQRPAPGPSPVRHHG